MKKKLEVQTIVVLLIVLGIAGSWIGIQVARDALGVWSESAELHFTTDDLLGLGARAEVHCAGGTIGHVRKVTSAVSAEGSPEFRVIVGIRQDYAGWRFAPVGTVKAGVVQSALSPPAIALELSTKVDAVQARKPKEGAPPVLRLERERKNNDLADVAEQYRKLGDRIDETIRQFTDPQKGRKQSVMQELADALPSASASLRQLETVTLSLSGQSPTKESDPAKLPPIERLLFNLDTTTANLSTTTASLNISVGEGGKIDRTLDTLNASLVRLQALTEQMSKTVGNLNVKLDTSLAKVNGLLDETTSTMSTMHGKIEGLGDTFVGRMLIKKKESTPVPAAGTSARKRSAPR